MRARFAFGPIFGSFLICVSGFAFGFSAFASSFGDRPFPEVVQNAPVIARGIAGLSQTKDAPGHDGIVRTYTYTEFKTSEALKGPISSGKKHWIRVLGGSTGELTMVVSGAPKFNPGEDLVLMLGPANPDGSYDVRGLMLGKYSVHQRTDASGEEIEVIDGPGLIASHAKPEGGFKPEDSIWTLASLRKLIQTQKKSGASDPAASAEGTLTAEKTPGSAPEADPGLSTARVDGDSMQSESVPESEDSFGFLFWALGGILVLAGMIIYWMRTS